MQIKMHIKLIQLYIHKQKNRLKNKWEIGRYGTSFEEQG